MRMEKRKEETNIGENGEARGNRRGNNTEHVGMLNTDPLVLQGRDEKEQVRREERQQEMEKEAEKRGGREGSRAPEGS